jgi:hypothetical protein
MSEPKTTCRHCDRSMLQRTAYEHDGLCVPCSQNAEVAMPDYIRLDDGLADRLLAIGEDPDQFFYREMLWRQGRQFLGSYVDDLYGLAAHQGVWLPRLREFVENCRRKRPVKPDDELTDVEREVLRIVEARLAKDVFLTGEVIFFVAPFAALRAIEAVRDLVSQEVVALTTDEFRQWLEVCPDCHGEDGWSTSHRFDVRTSGVVLDTSTREDDGDGLETGEEPWIATYDFYGGPTFGHGEEELWGWDGKRARVVRTLSLSIS